MSRGRARALACSLAALAAGAGCSFERRSPAFACETQGDCTDGRVCQNGWCVEVTDNTDGGDGGGDGGDDGGGGSSDGAPDGAFVCPEVCTRCDVDNTCIIICDPDSSCDTQVICPADIPCKVECNGVASCGAGIDCTGAPRCNVECTNQDACAGPILCGTGNCLFECTGTDSCTGGIDCEMACACVTLCEGAGSCTPPPICRPEVQCTKNGECSVENAQCNTCGG